MKARLDVIALALMAFLAKESLRNKKNQHNETQDDGCFHVIPPLCDASTHSG